MPSQCLMSSIALFIMHVFVLSLRPMQCSFSHSNVFFNYMQWGTGEDVTDPDLLKTVEAAVRRSTSVKRIKIECDLEWTNVATAILKGAAQSKPLREVELDTPEDFPQEVVDDVRRAKPKLRLVVCALGESASHDITCHWHTAPHVVCLVSQLCLSGVRWSVGASVSQ